MRGTDEGPAALELRGIAKRFGATWALRDAALRVGPGTIHGVVGPNGAGKSTLMRIAAGQLAPDDGTISVAGTPVVLRGPRAAARAGIAMMPQEQTLVPDTTVEENVALGHDPARWGFVRRAARRDAVRRTLERIGVAIDPRSPVAALAAPEQRMVMLARALFGGARVLVLDEPTAALGREDAARLLDTVAAARDGGTAIVYVSHRFAEVRRLCDSVTVLRDGATVERLDGAAITADALVRAVVTAGALDDVPPRRAGRPVDGPVAAALRGVHGRQLRGVDVEVRAGEIVGVCGLAGSGVSELLEVVGGVAAPQRGSVVVAGRARRFREPFAAVRHGIAMLPAERSRAGMLRRPVRENLLATRIRDVATRGFVTAGAERRAAGPTLTSFGLAERADDPLGALSGGNRQKVLLGRCICADARVVVLDDPTVGVDVAARHELHRTIRSLADDGRAVLIAAGEVEELVAVADRVVVLARGRVVAELRGDALTPGALVERMAAEAGSPRAG